MKQLKIHIDLRSTFQYFDFRKQLNEFHLRLHFWKFIIDDMYNLHIRLNFKSSMGPWWRQRVGSTTPKFRSLTWMFS